jgi:hypothetical protein
VFPLAQDLLRLELTLFTRVRRNMKSLPLSLQEKALLNARINPFKPKRNLQLETTVCKPLIRVFYLEPVGFAGKPANRNRSDRNARP